jgi:hypothetical protein
VVSSENIKKPMIWHARVSSSDIAKARKWTNAEGRNTVKNMVSRHRMI